MEFSSSVGDFLINSISLIEEFRDDPTPGVHQRLAVVPLGFYISGVEEWVPHGHAPDCSSNLATRPVHPV